MARRAVAWDGAGINFGHDAVPDYTPAVHDASLGDIQSAGYRYIRVAMPTFTYGPGVAKMRGITTGCLDRGLVPMYGVTASAGVPVTATVWGDFLASLDVEAAWARDNNVPYLLMGNEEELHVDGTTLTWATAVADLKAKATFIKNTIGFRGKVVYSSSEYGYSPNSLVWGDAAALGDIDMVGWNVYASPGNAFWISNLRDMVRNLGVDRTFISEWNYPSGAANRSEGDYARRMVDRWRWIQSSGIRIACLFAYQWSVDDSYAMKANDGIYRGAWGALRN